MSRVRQLSKCWVWIKRHWKWETVIALIGLVTIPVGIYYGRLTAPRPSHLSATALMDIGPLSSALNILGGSFELYYHNEHAGTRRRVLKPRIAIVSIKNDGRGVFDWQGKIGGPITIAVTDGEILRASFAAKSAPARIEVAKDGICVSISSDFLNPDEAIELVIVYEAKAPSLHCDERIRDQENLVLSPLIID